MTSLIRGFVGSLSDALDINQATLSGCIDIIIVEREDGSRHSTPFHVRFGKLQLLRSREKLVTIYVNGEKTPLTMKLGRAGEAYFYEQFETDTDGEWSASPLHSPLQSPLISPEKYRPGPEYDDDDDDAVVQDIVEGLLTSIERIHSDDYCGDLIELPSDKGQQGRDSQPTLAPLNLGQDQAAGDILPLLDLGSAAVEIHKKPAKRSTDRLWSVWSWGWGSLPVRKLTTASSADPVDEDMLDLDSIYMEVARTNTSSASVPAQISVPEHAGRSLSWVSSFIGIFRGKSDPSSLTLEPPLVDVRVFVTKRGHVRIKIQPRNVQKTPSAVIVDKSEEEESIESPTAAEIIPPAFSSSSPIMSPADSDTLPLSHCVELSLCAQDFNTADHSARLIRFRENLITHDRLCSDPFVIYDPNLMIRYQDLFYPGKAALPLIMSYLAFGRPLTPEAMDKLQVTNQVYVGDAQLSPGATPTDSAKSSFLYRWFSQDVATTAKAGTSPSPSVAAALPAASLSDQGAAFDNPISAINDVDSNPDVVEVFAKDSASEATGGADSTSSPKASSSHKTLRPTSDMLRLLNLNFGQNLISFCVESALQGMQLVEGFIYLWPESAKIVISDVDGTITRSDLLGNIMPLMGKDWSQVGVTSFFSNIVANGYNILYLTSRAIGQANVTRTFLSSIRQGAISLPQGPVIMSPDSLISSFKREVIYRRPQEFKIPALRDVANLFPEGISPFVAGFGNRDTDIESYIAVGIPLSMIFIIDPKGSIHRMKSIHRTSYSILNDQVEHMFPPFNQLSSRAHSSFSEFHYWREPVRSLEDVQGAVVAQRNQVKIQVSSAVPDELEHDAVSESR